MFDRGWDLAALIRARRFRLLLNVIEHLPRDSAYGEALASDEELAAQVDGSEGGPGAWHPPLSEWSPETELLAAIFDRLGDLVQAQVEKPLKLEQWPRPMTAADMLRAKERARKRARVRELYYPSE